MVAVEERRQLWRMMKLGIPVGFDSTRGKVLPRVDMSTIRTVTKRQPRQYINRRGGFMAIAGKKERMARYGRIQGQFWRTLDVQNSLAA
ncbi:hypothetical protein NL676_034760 [Syzygium grande]|nr:hypothetical protein NL676_034760 [Syzygium grande]